MNKKKIKGNRMSWGSDEVREVKGKKKLKQRTGVNK